MALDSRFADLTTLPPRQRQHRLEEALQKVPWRLTDFLLRGSGDPVRVEALDRISGQRIDPASHDPIQSAPLPFVVRIRTIDGLPFRVKAGHRYLDRTGRELRTLMLQGEEPYDYVEYPGDAIVPAHHAIQALLRQGVGIAFPARHLRKTPEWRMRSRVVEMSAHAWKPGATEPPTDASAAARLKMDPEWKTQLDRFGSSVLLGIAGWAPVPQEAPEQLSVATFERIAAIAGVRGSAPQAAPAPRRRGRPRKEAAQAG